MTGTGDWVDDDDNCPNEKVWCKGEKCQVVWSCDGKTYKCRIRLLRKVSSMSQALVHFFGYDSENDEWMNVSDLKPLSTPSPRKRKPISEQANPSHKNCMFSPLRGDEEKQRLEEKFKVLDDMDDEEVESEVVTPKRRKSTGKQITPPTPSSSHQKNKRRKTPIQVTGGQSKASTSNNSGGLADIGKKLRQNCSEVVTSAEDDSGRADRMAWSRGFDEEDFIKPKFTHKATSDCVHFVLTSAANDPQVKIPANINQYLHQYQRDGVKFLYEHYARGQGALLADDMGLGKTVQVIAFIAAIKYKTGTQADVLDQRPSFIRKMSGSDTNSQPKTKPCLVIAPASVLHNWLQEFETWGHFITSKYHQNEKSKTITDLQKDKTEVVITTFETARDNIMELNRFRWEAIFADEVHKIKSTDSNLTQMLKGLTCKVRFGLTGTPMQNNLDEFWCVLDWVKPGCLGNLTSFTNKYAAKIKNGQKQDASKRQLAEARKAQEELATLVQPYMLRRTKKLIAHQLPSKVEQVVYCQPTELQVDIYQAILQHDLMQAVLKQKHPCTCASGRPRSKCCYKTLPGGQSVRSVTFTFMHLLLKASNHIALLLPEKTPSFRQKTIASEICLEVFEKHPQFVNQAMKASFRTLSDPRYCGKMKVLQGLLSVFKKQKSRILLFSYSTQLLDIIETYVMTQGFEYRRLDGTTSGARRAKTVTEFNKDPSIFLLLVSTKAGGVGLNLTGANIVIIFDPNWNPTHDLQAEDRAYRIGQHRDVHVYRLVTSGMVEENIYLRQIYKQQLGHVAVSSENAVRYFNAVEGDKANRGELFGLENMFKLRTGKSCLTTDIIKRQDKIEAGLEGFQVEPYILKTPDKEERTSSETLSCDESGDSGGTREHIHSNVFMEDAEDNMHVPKDARGRYKSSKAKLSKEQIAASSLADKVKNGSCEDSDTDSVLALTAKKRLKSLFTDANQGSNSDTDDVTGHKGSSDCMNESFDSVTDVLEHCGVVHRHENRHVVGTSTAENHMTNCAIKDVFLLQQNSQLPAALCEPIHDPSESDSEPLKSPSSIRKKHIKLNKSKGLKKCSSFLINKTRILYGQTPKATRRAQFEKMATFLKFDNPGKLAKHVVSASCEDQRDMLRRFYCHLNKDVAELFEEPLLTVKPETTQHKTAITKSKRLAKRPIKSRESTAKGCCYYDDSEEEPLPRQLTVERKPHAQVSSEVRSKVNKMADDSFDEIINHILDSDTCSKTVVHSGISKKTVVGANDTDRKKRTEESVFDELDDIFLSPPGKKKLAGT